jgi:hypothetical protein
LNLPSIRRRIKDLASRKKKALEYTRDGDKNEACPDFFQRIRRRPFSEQSAVPRPRCFLASPGRPASQPRIPSPASLSSIPFSSLSPSFLCREEEGEEREEADATGEERDRSAAAAMTPFYLARGASKVRSFRPIRLISPPDLSFSSAPEM